MIGSRKIDSREVWEKFWAERKVDDIYPPVTDIVAELQKLIADFKGKKILEIGAGTGRTGFKLAELGAEVSLLDYSVNSLKMMQNLVEKVQRPINLIMADALRAPLASNSFDVILHQGLLEHFKTPFPLLQENVRLLKPGGYILVDVPKSGHFYTIMKHGLMSINKWFGGWERQFTVGSLKNLLERYNLKTIHVYGDWSRPGIFYKILRMGLMKFKIRLPMYPMYFGPLTKKFYGWQVRVRNKRLFLWTVLSIGIIAQKDANSY